MGNTILVSVFDSERTAFEGLTALKDLHRGGAITLYASTVIAKEASGNVLVRQHEDRGPLGTLVGAVTGGLVGVLGGPIGIAVGAYLGAFGGAMYDLFDAGISLDFVDEVSASLVPGKAAIVADIDETWVTPVDALFDPLGATSFRRIPGEILDTQLIRETEAARAQLEQLRAEVQEASGEARANVERAIEVQRRKLEALNDRIGTAIAKQDAEFQARLATLREQQATARDGQRERIAARMDQLRVSHETRKAKLEEARRLAKASVEATREALVG